jgi:hypothetical protein
VFEDLPDSSVFEDLFDEDFSFFDLAGLLLVEEVLDFFVVVLGLLLRPRLVSFPSFSVFEDLFDLAGLFDFLAGLLDLDLLLDLDFLLAALADNL